MIKVGDILASKYKLVEELVYTSSSQVFIVSSQQTGVKCVAKIITEAKQDNYGIYEHEIRILKSIQHSNMVRLLDSGRCSKHSVYYIITEYIDGKPLDEHFRRIEAGRARLACCIASVFKLLEPLELIHQKGFVHKDIKPSNILVEDDDEPYLLDFGISQAIETLTTQSCGYSPAYASPEELKRGEISPATDIYKLGITIIESVLDADAARSFREGDIPLDEAINQIVENDSVIADILHQMTEVKVEDRYESIRELRKDFKAWLGHAEEYALVFAKSAKDKAIKALDCPSYDVCTRMQEELKDTVFAEWKEDQKRGSSIEIATENFFLRLKPDDSHRYFTIVDFHGGSTDNLKQHGVLLEKCAFHVVSSHREIPHSCNEAKGLMNKLQSVVWEKQQEKEKQAERKTFLEQANAYQHAEREVFEKKRFKPFLVSVVIHRGKRELVCTLKESFQISEEHYKSDESPAAIRKKLEGWGVQNVHDQSIEGLLNNFISKRKVYGDWLKYLKKPMQARKFRDVHKVELSKAANDDERQKMAYEILMYLFSGELKRPQAKIFLPEQASEIGFYESDPSRQKQGRGDSPLLHGTLSKRDPNRKSLTLKYGDKQQDRKINTKDIGWIAHFSIREESQLQKKERALKELEDNKGINQKLIEVLAKVTHLQPKDESSLMLDDYQNKGLDDNQKMAVAKSVLLEYGEFCVLQGPPGTGKTTVITEIIQQVLRETPKAKILVASQSHQAVDNVLEKVCDDARVVRLGDEERLTGVAKNYAYEKVASTMLDDIKHNIEQEACYLDERGIDTISDDELERLEELRKEWFLRLSGRDEHLESILFKSIQVAFGTLVGMAATKYEGVNQKFDYVIVDEAGKAILSELAICMNRGERIILVGDHKQLPPILDEESLASLDANTKKSLKTTFFEDLYTSLEKERPEYCHMLNHNYRMHASICEPVSQLFYDGDLATPPIVKREHQLPLKYAFYWLNTSKLAKHYESSNGQGKYFNTCHSQYIADLLTRLEQQDTQAKTTVAVIAPYRESIAHLKKVIQPKSDQWKKLDIEIATVDSFQGSDRDIVILDSVRSNQGKKLGFIADAARLNVALSRAKALLFIIGDADMLYDGRVPKGASNPYQHLIEYIRNKPEQYGWVDLTDSRGLEDVQ